MPQAHSKILISVHNFIVELAKIWFNHLFLFATRSDACGLKIIFHLFVILPSGVVSKNESGDLSTPCNMSLCRVIEDRLLPSANVIALATTITPENGTVINLANKHSQKYQRTQRDRKKRLASIENF